MNMCVRLFKAVLLTFYAITCLWSCSSPSNKSYRLLKLDNFKAKVLSADDPIMYVTLLHSYRIEKSDIQSTSVNLYVCQEYNSKDSIFVFDINEFPDQSLFDLDNKNESYIINESEVKNINLREVIVQVPSGFKTPKKIGFLFSTLLKPLD
ncbi:MAG: hypothetical protein JWQ25_460 [Daejeonella sp.]|nr:hypothetical protein [Daejeonella sp.]